jgi:hypothetical protein
MPNLVYIEIVTNTYAAPPLANKLHESIETLTASEPYRNNRWLGQLAECPAMA